MARKKIKFGFSPSLYKTNIKDILSVGNVEGVLVGGSSLKIKEFLAIYSSAVMYLN